MVGVDCDPSPFTHPALTTTVYQGVVPKPRVYYHLGLSPDIKYVVHNSSIVNLTRAVVSRVLLHKGAPVVRPSRSVKDCLSDFRIRLCKHLPSTIPVDHSAFVELYKDRRKEVYRKAAESLLLQPLERRDSYLKAFVKAERICVEVKSDPDPRVIQPRDPRYNVELGCYLKPIEHSLYQAVANVFKERTIFKGLNAEQSGVAMRKKWDKYLRPVAIGLDASRFDQHVSKEMLQWEHSIYRRVFGNDPWLMKLLDWQINNVGFGYTYDGRLKYKVEGCRMSGDMNTALGNCLLMCAMVYTYCKEMGIKKYSLANNGDDCIVIMERRFLNRFQARLKDWFLELGFQMKVEDPVYEFEHIEFCQTHPVWTPTGYRMVRNFPNSLSKDNIAIKPLDTPGAWAKWLRAISEGGLALTGGIPVAQDFYACCLRAAKTVPGYDKRSKFLDSTLENSLYYLSRGMHTGYSEVHPYTRYSYWIAFGVTPDQQVAYESYFQKFDLKFDPRSREHPLTMPLAFKNPLGH